MLWSWCCDRQKNVFQLNCQTSSASQQAMANCV